MAGSFKQLSLTGAVSEVPLIDEFGQGSTSPGVILSETKRSIKTIQEVLFKKGTILIVNSCIFSIKSNKKGVYVFESKTVESGLLTNDSRAQIRKSSNMEKVPKPDIVILLGSSNTLLNEARLLCIPTILIDLPGSINCKSDYIIPVDISSKNSLLFLTYLLGGLFEA